MEHVYYYFLFKKGQCDLNEMNPSIPKKLIEKSMRPLMSAPKIAAVTSSTPTLRATSNTSTTVETTNTGATQ